ncbi:MAG: ABC transporter ATP-binding protein [Myxococcota bacterium]
MSASAPTGPALRVSDLSKSFGPQIALRNVTLSVPRGSFVALLGPNGAGKTTLLKILAGLARPSGGDVRVLGEIPQRHTPGLRSRIGFVSHKPQLYSDLPAEENLQFFGALYGVPHAEARITEVLDRVELLSRRRDPVRMFSHGMTQRLSIARALLHDPELLLLDEPTTGLDDRAIGILMDLLSSLHDGTRTLLMTTHRMEVGLRMADRVAVLVGGRIAHEETARVTDTGAFRSRYAALTGAPQ